MKELSYVNDKLSQVMQFTKANDSPPPFLRLRFILRFRI